MVLMQRSDPGGSYLHNGGGQKGLTCSSDDMQCYILLCHLQVQMVDPKARTCATRLFICSVVALAALQLLPFVRARQACEESNMCSVGTSQQWVGDIKSSGQLHAMLKAVSYKQELIITIYSGSLSGEQFYWTDQVLQLHYELMSMGYAHHLLVANDEQGCQAMKGMGLSCVWDSSDLPCSVMCGETALWYNRWKLLARAVRLGYNVMSVDTDFIFFRDPYVHVKRPPLSGIQMFCNIEGGSIFDCNGGFMYVQNVRPDGPVSWVFMEVVRSTLRRGDDQFKFLSQWTRHQENCLTFDQAIITEALSTAGVGRPIHINSVGACKSDAKFTTRIGTKLNANQVRANIEALMDNNGRSRTQKSAPDMQWLNEAGFRILPDMDTEHLVTNLTVPNINYGYPEELGGRFFPDSADKPLSSPWEAMLRADCPYCQWWLEARPVASDPIEKVLGPDFASPKVLPENLDLWRDASIATEVMAHTPRWLSCSLAPTRRGAVVGLHSDVQGYPVMGHVHYWYIQTSRPHKGMLRKIFGRYNWTSAVELANKANIPSPYLSAREVTRVLALSPEMDLSRTRSWAELSSIIAGLFQVAFLSRRAVWLPDIPCQAAWLHSPKTLSDPARKNDVCLPPMFWGHDFYREPFALPVAVDTRGELVGGWAENKKKHRKLQAVKNGKIDDNTDSDITLHHTSNDEMTADSRIRHEQDIDSYTRISAKLVNGNSRASARQMSETEHSMLSGTFWTQHRYVAVLPAAWDMPCARELHGLISPEVFHWIQTNPAAEGLRLEPTATNTVFLPDPNESKLKLNPGLNPGGDSKAVPAGQVVPTSDQLGWAWKDVQVALSASKVFKAMQGVSDQPLVYLGHPVMVVPGTTPEDAAEQMTFSHDHGQSSSVMHPNAAITHINHRLRSSHCRLVKDSPGHEGSVIDLNHGLPGDVSKSGYVTIKPGT